MTGILASFGGIKNAAQTTFDYAAAGTGTLTIPGGFTTCIVQVWGAGGGGGRGWTDGVSDQDGGGGGAGGYAKSSLTVTGAAGQTIAYTVGTGGIPNGGSGSLSNAYAGTFSMTTLTGNGGAAGQGGLSGGAGGAGGTATGGSVTNTTGGTGGSPDGGTPVAGDSGLTGGAGGQGGAGPISGSGLAGSDGRVRFVFS